MGVFGGDVVQAAEVHAKTEISRLLPNHDDGGGPRTVRVPNDAIVQHLLNLLLLLFSYKGVLATLRLTYGGPSGDDSMLAQMGGREGFTRGGEEVLKLGDEVLQGSVLVGFQVSGGLRSAIMVGGP